MNVKDLFTQQWLAFCRRVFLLVKFFSTSRVTLIVIVSKKQSIAALFQINKKQTTLLRLMRGDGGDGRVDLINILAEERLFFHDVIMIMARDQVVVRNTEIPSVDRQEIQEIVYQVASKQTPFSQDEILVDFKIVKSELNQFSQILLGLVPKEIVENLIKAFASQGNIRRIVLSSECLCLFAPAVNKQLHEDHFAIIDCQDDYLDFSVISEGRLLFTRLMQVRPLEFKLEGAAEKFFTQLQMCWDVYNREEIGPAPKVIVLVGNVVLSQTILDWKKTDHDSKLSEVLFYRLDEKSLVQGLYISQEATDDFHANPLESFILLTLIAANSISLNFYLNFVPHLIKQAHSREKQWREFLRISFFGFMVLAIAMGVFMQKRFSEVLLLQSLQIQLAKIEKQTVNIRREKLKIDIIKNHFNINLSAMDVLLKIQKLVPQSIYISSIDYTMEKDFKLRGSAVAVAEVKEFVSALRDLKEFNHVEIEYFSERNVSGKILIDFEINGTLGEP